MQWWTDRERSKSTYLFKLHLPKQEKKQHRNKTHNNFLNVQEHLKHLVKHIETTSCLSRNSKNMLKTFPQNIANMKFAFTKSGTAQTRGQRVRACTWNKYEYWFPDKTFQQQSYNLNALKLPFNSVSNLKIKCIAFILHWCPGFETFCVQPFWFDHATSHGTCPSNTLTLNQTVTVILSNHSLHLKTLHIETHKIRDYFFV